MVRAFGGTMLRLAFTSLRSARLLTTGQWHYNVHGHVQGHRSGADALRVLGESRDDRGAGRDG